MKPQYALLGDVCGNGHGHGHAASKAKQSPKIEGDMWEFDKFTSDEMSLVETRHLEG